MKRTIVKMTTLGGTLCALASTANAGVTHLDDQGAVSSVGLQQNDGALRSMLSTPGRVTRIGDDLPPMLSQGTQEFGISGNVNFAEDLAYNLQLTYGWFIRDNWQFGFTADVQGEDSDATFGAGLFTEYNFANGDSKWVPFIGMSAKWAKLNSDALDADSIALGADFGIKYFVRENVAISFSIGADFAFDDVFPGGDDFQENIKIGTRFYF